MMPVALIDPVEQLRRRHWWAGLFLSVLATLHYILAAPAFLFFGVSLLSAASRMVQRFGNWGVVSQWDAQGLALAIVGLAYGAGTVYSGRLIERRARRGFSLAWATAHLFTVVGVPLALLTWAALSLPSVRELYEGTAVPFEPRLVPPPVPLRVLAVPAPELPEDSAAEGE